MPETLNWQDINATVCWTGVVDDNDLARVAERITGDRRFDDLRWVLHDFRECEGLLFHPENVEVIAATDSVAVRTNPDILIVVVTTRDDVRAAFRAYTEAGVKAARLQVFDTIDAAQAWLLRNDKRAAEGA